MFIKLKDHAINTKYIKMFTAPRLYDNETKGMFIVHVDGCEPIYFVGDAAVIVEMHTSLKDKLQFIYQGE